MIKKDKFRIWCSKRMKWYYKCATSPLQAMNLARRTAMKEMGKYDFNRIEKEVEKDKFVQITFPL
jgi:hypothetical protein